MIGKIRDTLIGLWPVIKTYVPKTGLIIAVVVAFLIGLIWSYLVDPLTYYDGDLRTLGQSWQDEWVRSIASEYQLAADGAVITPEFRQNLVTKLSWIDNPVEVVNRLGLMQIADLANEAQVLAPPTPVQPSILATIRPWLLGPIVIAVGFVIGSLLYGFYINPMVVEPIRKRIRGSQGTDAAGAAKIADIKAARVMAAKLSSDEAAAPTSNLGPPVVRHVSIYQPGRAYDDSFSIEDAKKDDEFLGECGAVISETIGAGQPEKVTAIEAWLFDKEDFVRTLTGVFASEHAYNDPAIRAKLAEKGEVVVAKPGAILKLETNTLTLQVRIVDMTYGTGPLPPNSYFDKLTMELQAWRRSGAPVGVTQPAMPVPAMPATNYAPPPTAPVYAPQPAPTFAPPPAAPATFTPPPAQSMPSPFAPQQRPAASPPPATYGGGLTPLKPPPLQSPRQDDDPFGGSGDFTPVG